MHCLSWFDHVYYISNYDTLSLPLINTIPKADTLRASIKRQHKLIFRATTALFSARKVLKYAFLSLMEKDSLWVSLQIAFIFVYIAPWFKAPRRPIRFHEEFLLHKSTNVPASNIDDSQTKPLYEFCVDKNKF